MALRKASAYSSRINRPFTRKSNVKSKSYIKTIPPQKIAKFKMGDINGYNSKKFPILIRVASGETANIRDNAIESVRQYVHKELEESMAGNYYFEVKVFPHHILRENKMLTGAGADRMQTGMARSFGANIGRAAIVKANHDIFIILVTNEKDRKTAITILEKVKAKLPCHTRLVIEKLKQ